MNFHDLVLKNRSVRAYDESRTISREELISLIELARVTPSAANRQPLKYFLSCDAETNALIQPMTGWGGTTTPKLCSQRKRQAPARGSAEAAWSAG